MPCLCNLLNDNLIWLVLIALIILYFCNYDSSDLLFTHTPHSVRAKRKNQRTLISFHPKAHTMRKMSKRKKKMHCAV